FRVEMCASAAEPHVEEVREVSVWDIVVIWRVRDHGVEEVIRPGQSSCRASGDNCGMLKCRALNCGDDAVKSHRPPCVFLVERSCFGVVPDHRQCLTTKDIRCPLAFHTEPY